MITYNFVSNSKNINVNIKVDATSSSVGKFTVLQVSSYDPDANKEYIGTMDADATALGFDQFRNLVYTKAQFIAFATAEKLVLKEIIDGVATTLVAAVAGYPGGLGGAIL